MKYRKKPVVIEAFEWQPNIQAEIAPEWFFDACRKRTAYPEYDGSLTIRTLEGNHRCNIGDYVIQGVNGELYPCKPDIFAKTYEEVPE